MIISSSTKCSVQIFCYTPQFSSNNTVLSCSIFPLSYACFSVSKIIVTKPVGYKIKNDITKTLPKTISHFALFKTGNLYFSFPLRCLKLKRNISQKRFYLLDLSRDHIEDNFTEILCKKFLNICNPIVLIISSRNYVMFQNFTFLWKQKNVCDRLLSLLSFTSSCRLSECLMSRLREWISRSIFPRQVIGALNCR